MLKVITGTIAARIITTAMGLLISVIAGHRLGLEGLGTIGLIVLGITLIRLGMDLVGGSALVYLVPRVALGRLLRPGYLWAVLAAGVGYGIVRVFKLVPEGYAGDVAVLAFLQGIHAIHLSVLIGQQRIRANNIIAVVQAVVLVAAFGVLARAPEADAHAFITASYISIGAALLLSIFSMRKHVKPHAEAPQHVIRLLLRQGAYVQVANGMQLMNYRLAYWLIEKFQNTAALGIYTVANQLAEGAWLVPKSLAVVLYSKISNTEGPEGQRLLTLTFLKTSMACASAVVLVLVLLPSTVFQWVFGPEVVGITPLILLLVPGILSMAASQAYSHFFSGTARNVHNVIGSGLGLVATVVAGLLLIPAYGLFGAAISATLAYSINAVYQTIAFMRITGSSFTDLWPNAADGRRLRGMFLRQGSD
ncbi:MAG: polysaccharide biosynthesis C-terminal domain-containing protein [Flavobacteriales bacterium]|nr:polysaccharide biosynthesis C-terminal domain-containing protein [Flavobacteriales bacterium]MBK6894324.1 polysaccharide biosynthesis C-terminal domain-containing protein [Flavobacteriales bacterium]MBK7248253.1 polysaccharide biosynthesis C-terminal domain-containing protein [Flavobacteriales bacterium]MBK9598082.1 polysaccharide biosynthesis C-terminal domain-containing protein [Flavobacteriales bacterium]QQS73514.1 MAG: polysaccharide biosynthesis C-terminal domain-containing protein [Fla